MSGEHKYTITGHNIKHFGYSIYSVPQVFSNDQSKVNRLHMLPNNLTDFQVPLQIS